MSVKDRAIKNRQSVTLFLYDLVVACAVANLMLFAYLKNANHYFKFYEALTSAMLYIEILFAFRLVFKIYKQVWRYGGVQCYLRLIVVDVTALIVFYIVERLIPIKPLTFGNTVSLFSIDLITVLTMRIMYRYCYKFGNDYTPTGRILSKILHIFSFGNVKASNHNNTKKIPVAILGAGEVGVELASNLLSNPNSMYVPRMFIESNPAKIGRNAGDLKIYSEYCDLKVFETNEIQEVIFTANLDFNKRQELYQRFKNFGLKVKTFSSPTLDDSEKVVLREFDVEELLFRKPRIVLDKKIVNYYKNKTVLITGGGGSIGSEMARQVAKMNPKRIILLDIYENGAYDVKQELSLIYKNKVDVQIEICSITNRELLETVFKTHKPNIVIMAAAHKHVPLMEHNVIEAINNNVFGTLNTVELSEEYKVDRVIMVSTDKAVNPTNVMGATKRMCEMIVKNHSTKKSHTTYSMTRFGNVLGSAGSVIPLFKRQIKYGGPITLTDKRIIRYFMTIPEASQLVLKSGAMAKNGELFVLDMGEPVKIIDLAESLIKLSGLVPYKDIDIIETGLRPGEKMYEELLINAQSLQKTDDELIFIDQDEALSNKTLTANLNKLAKAVKANDDKKAKQILHEVVPTYK